MKKFKARKEREQLEAIVRPPFEIEDPSAELFSPSRLWEREDPLQDSFLEQSEEPRPTRDHCRLPKLKFRSTSDMATAFKRSPSSQTDSSEDGDEVQPWQDQDTNTSQPEQFSEEYNDDPEAVFESTPAPPILPPRHPNHTHGIPIRSRSMPPSRDLYQLSVSPPKTDFKVFSQRCAPSPTSASPIASTPVFELSAEEALYSLASALQSDSPVELEGSPVEDISVYAPPSNTHNKSISEPEPEASPYNRFTAYAKSIHALSASLSPIEETEEEAASRRSSIAQIYELSAIAPLNPIPPSAYSGGTSITPRTYRPVSTKLVDPLSPLYQNVSTRSSNSTISRDSMHSVFSFEFSNSDTEKIYISAPGDRRESSAPSLTDESSLDDFDIDCDLELETRRSRSVSKRDAKLERFFGIRAYSVGPESDTSSDTAQSPTFERRPTDNSQAQSTPRHTRSSIDELDLSLALENDPYRREIISMHKSLLYKTQSKQDAKLEKFFGCDKDQIEIARKSSTGSRLAGCTDDLKYRTIGPVHTYRAYA